MADFFFFLIFCTHMTVCFFICISTKKIMCINSSVSRAWLIECCVSLNVWSHGFRYDFMKNQYNVNVNRDTCSSSVIFIMKYLFLVFYCFSLVSFFLLINEIWILLVIFIDTWVNVYNKMLKVFMLGTGKPRSKNAWPFCYWKMFIFF